MRHCLIGSLKIMPPFTAARVSLLCLIVPSRRRSSGFCGSSSSRSFPHRKPKLSEMNSIHGSLSAFMFVSAFVFAQSAPRRKGVLELRRKAQGAGARLMKHLRMGLARACCSWAGFVRIQVGSAHMKSVLCICSLLSSA
ncbi:hypothetical protein KSP39_PZI001528 [Platanthera zijinensis]|uniref:Uncharacterized protein n=1 Tax=Platanthera zijinensis TaxID=2320716 RepID=A0AAP0C3D8_9ASPA